MDKEKVFFIICAFVLTAGITIYSVSSDNPDTKPVISTYISNERAETVTSPKNTEKSIKYPIDINFATKEELCSLDGIGNTLSDRIIEYRNKNYFYSVEDIKKVNGIGDKFIEENKDKITVDISKLPTITTYQYTTTDITTVATETMVVTETKTTEETESSTVKTEIIVTKTEIITTEKEIKRVNLNTATYEELVALPISPEIAKQILELRTKMGYFSSVRELCYIESYNLELYNELIKYVYVE